MASKRELLESRSISPASVRDDGPLTIPRSFGVYVLPASHGSTRRYRFGNHPVRLNELVAEFGDARLHLLFRVRSDAEALAKILNESP